MFTSLLTSKLCIPPMRPALVPRPHLMERLNAGLHRMPSVTLVSAPAGYGKTTLISAWLHGTDHPVAWLSLDESDNDLPRFLAYLVAALQEIQAGIGRSVLAALQLAGMPGAPQPSTETLLTGLINETAAAPVRFVLVLDDYHLITVQPVHDALGFLIDHLPGNVHLVIATRADPPLPLARLRGRGQLTELRQADLRFAPDEAAEFLRRVMDLPLSADDVATLASRTEGWIAGLQLAALSMHGLDDASTFVQAFAGSDRYVLDYLAAEVLQRQPAHVQRFLLQTAILDRLSGPLCDAVLVERGVASGERDPGASRMLEYLEHANLFIVPLDNRREWYRYHRLFADLLRKRLHETGPALVPALHRRASAWYERHDLLEEAIEHALAAGDAEHAADLVEQVAEATLMRSEIATFLGWMESLPDETVRARPLLCTWHAGALLLNGSPLEIVEARLQDAVEGDAADSSVDKSAGAAAVFRGLVAVVQGDQARGIALSHQALALLPEGDIFLRSTAADALGMAYVLAGDTESAIQAFEEAARMGERGGNVMFAVAALCNLVGLAVDRGQLRRAAAGYRRALGLATDEQGRRLPVASRALMGLGTLAQEWNDLDVAARHFQESLELSQQYAEMGALFCCLHLARVRQMQGDVDGAEDMIQQARRIAIQYDVTEMDDRLVDLTQVRLWLAQGNVAAAARWMDEAAVPTGPPPFPELREGEELTRARVYLARRQADDALVVLEPLLHVVEGRGRMRRVVELLALQALALQSRGDTEAALAALARALSLAGPEGYVRTFVDEGQPMAQLLYEAAARGIAPAYVGQLLAAFEVSEHEIRPTQPLVEPLSERELEVLGLIAEGLSNRQIADHLVISLSTVKGHTANIYGKLGVHSRTQAVARARTLGILPGS